MLPKRETELCATTAWDQLIVDLLGDDQGEHADYRELLCHTTKIDMNRPILLNKARQLGYKFMAAEAAWILSGDNKVMTIEPYSKRIVQFSDDGYTFFGAYGPKVIDQIPYILDTLRHDMNSRQAVISIWREQPRKTKDVPCTTTLQFLIRPCNTDDHQGDYLDCVATMRSSDAWLGWPYDVFNFSMISRYIGLFLQMQYPHLRLGTLYLTAGSQHLYARDVHNAADCVYQNTSTLEVGTRFFSDDSDCIPCPVNWIIGSNGNKKKLVLPWHLTDELWEWAETNQLLIWDDPK